MQTHDPVDVVTMGAGWTAGIIAQQLTDQGMSVVSLERGQNRWAEPDFEHNHDGLRYSSRYHLHHQLAKESWTWRPEPGKPALPMRTYGSFHPGQGLGGAGVHWAGETWRFFPSDFQYRSHHIERYGEDKLPENTTVQDWPITYDELEPYYDRWEYDVGVSGTTGNLGGQVVNGGNPFEGPRRRTYPLPPLQTSIAGKMFAEGAQSLGLHPFPQPVGILSEAYTDMSGQERAGCIYCGFCVRYGCEVDAKSSAIVAHIPMAMDTGRYEVRQGATVIGIEMADNGRATGLRYLDNAGQEHLQPADVVVMSGYPLSNVRLMLMSTGDAHADGVGNNQGMLGKNFTYQLVKTPVHGLFEGQRLNSFMGNAGVQQIVHDFNADNFDHSDLDFIGGAGIEGGGGERQPLMTAGDFPVVGDGKDWGADWKEQLRHWDSWIPLQIQGESLPYPEHTLDLDPNFTDAFGLPLLRLTFDFRENDYNLYRYLTERASEIMRAMNPTDMHVEPELEPYEYWPYQSTHITGGAIMGSDPGNSVTNKYGQVWDAENVFVTGATLYPQNPGLNPTSTLCALSYLTAEGIADYHRNPRMLT